MKYKYFEVRLNRSIDDIELGWSVKNKDKETHFESRLDAFNYLGNLGAYLKMQTKAGVFIFERPLSDGDKLIQCSGCLNQFTRDKVIYVDTLPYCSHCLNDERMEHENNNNLCQVCGERAGVKNSAYYGGDESGSFVRAWVCAECEQKVENEAAIPNSPFLHYGLQTCRGCKDKFSSDEIKYFDSDPYCGRCLDKNIGGYEDE